MNRRIFGYGLWLLVAVSPALGSPLISVSDQYMLNTNAQRQIPILVSSSPAEQVQGVDLAVQIGDGGTVNLGTNTAPRITNLDVVGPGTIFYGNNTGTGTLDDGTPLPVYLGSSGNNLIAATQTTTSSGAIGANGVLAYLTVNPSGAAIGSAYQVIMQNVGANYATGPWTSDFGSTAASFPAGIAYIHIVDLHQSVWNAGASGAWTNATWTNPQPPFPNYTTQAIVNTAYTVNVTSAQEANSLAISGGGNVAIGSAGSLAITAGLTVSTGGTLSVASTSGLSAAGIQLQGGTISGSGTLAPAVALSGGTLDTPLSGDNLILSLAAGGTGGLSKTGSGTATLLSSATYSGNTTITAGRLQLNGASSVLHAITGAGTLGVGNGLASSTLTADSIQTGALSVAAGSTVTIAPIPGGPQSSAPSLSSVPEPSTLTLLIAAAAGILFYRKKILTF
jgi:fibronectin-binding autotransporter adhesin